MHQPQRLASPFASSRSAASSSGLHFGISGMTCGLFTDRRLQPLGVVRQPLCPRFERIRQCAECRLRGWPLVQILVERDPRVPGLPRNRLDARRGRAYCLPEQACGVLPHISILATSHVPRKASCSIGLRLSCRVHSGPCGRASDRPREGPIGITCSPRRPTQPAADGRQAPERDSEHSCHRQGEDPWCKPATSSR